jgi:ADP-heptose:LPS heptosyltransferase
VTCPPPTYPFALAPLDLLRPLGVSPAPFPAIACPVARPVEHLVRFREQLGAYGVVHLGGRGDKAWPLDAWGRLLIELRERYRGTLVLVAGPDELDRIPSAALDLPNVVRAPLFEIEDLAHLLAESDGYLGCDTGPMHLACAVGTPVVALFFRSNPYHYAPLGAQHAVVLLADPYHVNDGAWEDGLGRARVFRPDAGGAEPRSGRPRTDAVALARIVEAVDSTWKRARERTSAETADALADRTRPS